MFRQIACSLCPRILGHSDVISDPNPPSIALSEIVTRTSRLIFPVSNPDHFNIATQWRDIGFTIIRAKKQDLNTHLHGLNSAVDLIPGIANRKLNPDIDIKFRFAEHCLLAAESTLNNLTFTNQDTETLRSRIEVDLGNLYFRYAATNPDLRRDGFRYLTQATRRNGSAASQFFARYYHAEKLILFAEYRKAKELTIRQLQITSSDPRIQKFIHANHALYHLSKGMLETPGDQDLEQSFEILNQANAVNQITDGRPHPYYLSIQSFISWNLYLRDPSSNNDAQWERVRSMFEQLDASERPREGTKGSSDLDPFFITINERLRKILEVEMTRYDSSRFLDVRYAPSSSAVLKNLHLLLGDQDLISPQWISTDTLVDAINRAFQLKVSGKHDVADGLANFCNKVLAAIPESDRADLIKNKIVLQCKPESGWTPILQAFTESISPQLANEIKTRCPDWMSRENIQSALSLIALVLAGVSLYFEKIK